MRGNKIFRLFSLSTLAVGLLVLALGSPVLFAYTRNEVYQMGMDKGYEYGFAQGQCDRENGARFNFNTPEYRGGYAEYDTSYGDFASYKRGFRAGYKAAYSDGYYEMDSTSYSNRRRHRNMDTGTYPDRRHRRMDTGTY